MSRLRIARTSADAHPLPSVASAPDAASWQRLQNIIRRHLSPATATLLAEPVTTADGAHVDWFTTLAGQPVRLSALGAAEQQRFRRLLESRIAAVRDLARKLKELEPDSALAASLLQATTYPDEDAVFVIDDQPVLTFWGYGLLPKEEPASTAERSTPLKRARWPWLLALALLAFGGLSWAAFHFSWLRWPPWGPDYAAILAEERAEGERLRRVLLDHRQNLVRGLAECALRAQLDALKQERALLGSTLQGIAGQVRKQLENCEKRAVEEEGINLWEKVTDLKRQLAEAQMKCTTPAAEEKQDKKDREADQKRAERERLRHVQVDGTLGCTGLRSRLFFKVPFDLGGGRFSVNFKGRDYDGSSITSRIDATYDSASRKMVLDLQTVDVGKGKKAMRIDRCVGTWRNETFYDPRCKLVRTSGKGNFCDPLWLRIKTKTKLGK